MNEQFIDLLRIIGSMTIELLPYIVLGVFLGELIKLASWTKLLRRSCLRFPLFSILFASFFGILSPLCTYGTIPIVLQLYQSGMPIQPLISFLAVSSLMNPQLFIFTWKGITPEMALIRVFSVLLFGFLLGLILLLFPRNKILNLALNQKHYSLKQCFKSSIKPLTLKQFFTEFWKRFQFIGFYMAIGIVLGSVIQVFVPGNVIFQLFNPGEWFSVPLAGLLGVPLYACGGGVIPLIRSLMLNGMSKGSALAFFLVGPATRITPLMALKTIVRPMFLGVYVISVMLYSLLAGFLYR
jgi:uncharacterized membrane protein YraQ (UPF0718 family)